MLYYKLTPLCPGTSGHTWNQDLFRPVVEGARIVPPDSEATSASKSLWEGIFLEV